MMNHFSVLFCFIFASLGLSFMGLVLGGSAHLGTLTQMTETADEDGNPSAGEPLFPGKPIGVAQQGKEVYQSLGCVYCHTQQVRRQGCGADAERGWGRRATVARDYITQPRALIGSRRIGPDLTTIGERESDANRHHLLLYTAEASPGKTSAMPRYPFLYTVREVEGDPSADALQFESGSSFAPEEGYEVIPTERAKVLVEYLLSLKLDYSLPEARIIEE